MFINSFGDSFVFLWSWYLWQENGGLGYRSHMFGFLRAYADPCAHAAWDSPASPCLIDSWPSQPVLFQILTVFLVLALQQLLCSQTVWREMSKACGSWVHGYFIHIWLVLYIYGFSFKHMFLVMVIIFGTLNSVSGMVLKALRSFLLLLLFPS